MEDRYSIKDAASMVGVSEYTIRRRILDSTILANKIMGKYYIDKEELLKYMYIMENGNYSCHFFDKYGILKDEFKNKEDDLIKDKRFIKEVNSQVYIGRRYSVESDLVRIYYLFMREVGNDE